MVSPVSWSRRVVVRVWVLIRWWVRHRHCRLAASVAPVGQGMRWSVSQRRAGRVQPGQRQVLSRARTWRSMSAGTW